MRPNDPTLKRRVLSAPTGRAVGARVTSSLKGEPMQLHEQHRPSCWSEVIGQDKVVKRIDALRKRGLTGRACWLSGQSGTGKTTIARLIAQEVASEWCIEEVDATDLSAARIGVPTAERSGDRRS